MTYADILLPLALPPLTYRAGDGELRPGMAVTVPLGRRKLYQGIVWRVHDQAPAFATRTVGEALYGGEPLLEEEHMRFWEWMAGYYMCPLGDVMAAAIPARLRPEGFSDAEFSGGQFSPSVVRYLKLHPRLGGETELGEALDRLKKAPRQYAAMMALTEALPAGGLFCGRVERKAVPCGADVVNALLKKELIITEDVPLLMRDGIPGESPLPELTPAQRRAADEIYAHMAEKPAVLLHGATGSGKTEIFISLAAAELQKGHSVLYLLPEIPISWQIVERLREVFGERLVASHSKYNPRRRADVFLQLCDRDGGPYFVVGTRSALLLPVRNLGMVIIDEEHDPSYKQENPAPRFHARDSALMLASILRIPAVLGSAAPSIESFYNASCGRYGLVSLTERYGGAPQPRILLSDSLRAAKRGEREAQFDKMLLDRLSATLEEGAQAIVFRNRRGFAPYVECCACAWVAHCPDCNVTLTLHKAQGRLRCHYCGYSIPAPRICPACRQGELAAKGYGTEKLEEELARIFPSARIERLDADTTSSPAATQKIITRFANGLTDILVGTQMVAKGFDFGGVRTVGVVGADNLLNYPDFRASERAFQILTQAAGRAGRRDVQGEVVIQSACSDHPVLRQVAAGDYHGMVCGQLAERRSFFYPPYCRLISLTFRCRDKEAVTEAAEALACSLRPVFGRRVLGPEPAAVDRVMGEHILKILLKIEREKSFAKAKRLLAGHLDAIRSRYKNVTLVCDVDPQ